MSPLARTVIVGLGNPLRGDDAVGLAVADELEHLLASHPLGGVVVRATDRAGFEMIDLLGGVNRAVVVDCFQARSPRPGLVRVLRPTDVAGSARLVGGHDLGVTEVLELAALMHVSMPERVDIIGIEGAETTEVQCGLTPNVALAARRVAAWLHLGLRLGLDHALAWLFEHPLPAVSSTAAPGLADWRQPPRAGWQWAAQTPRQGGPPCALFRATRA